MLCPFCNADHDKVVDSRSCENGHGIRRRRQCLACGRRYTTYERVEETLKLTVVKRDGSRVPYQRQKLHAGLEKACYKRPISAEQLEKLVEQIEEQLYLKYDREVESEEIGRLVSEHLKRVDRVAYVRYASVYKQFRDIEDLLAEVKDVIESSQPLDGPHQGKLF